MTGAKIFSHAFAYLGTVAVAFFPFWLAACFIQGAFSFGPFSRAWLASCCIYVGCIAAKKWIDE